MERLELQKEIFFLFITISILFREIQFLLCNAMSKSFS